MLKNHFILTFLFTVSSLFAQSNTEVFVMDLEFSETDFKIENFANITNNQGYDSQPYFVDDNQLLYARTFQNQTDIALFQLEKKSLSYVCKTEIGGEYSPQKIPNTNLYSAVRLDTTGLQRLYGYDSITNTSKKIIDNLQVAYYTFYDKNRILSSVLSGANLDLVFSDLGKKTNDTLLTKVGRSIHKVPNQNNTMSYTSINDEKNMDVYQLDINSLESFFVAQLPVGIQDYIWLNESTLLIGSLDKLYILDLYGNGDWKMVTDLSIYQLNNITRLALSPNGSKLAIVAELIEK